MTKGPEQTCAAGPFMPPGLPWKDQKQGAEPWLSGAQRCGSDPGSGGPLTWATEGTDVGEAAASLISTCCCHSLRAVWGRARTGREPSVLRPLWPALQAGLWARKLLLPRSSHAALRPGPHRALNSHIQPHPASRKLPDLPLGSQETEKEAGPPWGRGCAPPCEARVDRTQGIEG